MNLKKIITRFLIKTSILGLLVSLVFVNSTLGYFSDIEVSSGNTLETGTLDLGVYSLQGFTGGNLMEPGDVVTRDIYFQNLGNNPFWYRANYEYVSGNEDLCQGLQLRVLYNGTIVKYSGSLADFDDFDTNSPTHDPQLVLVPGSEQLFVFELTLPSNAGYLLEKTCTFDIRVKAWQVGLLETESGFWDEETIESTVSTVPRCPNGEQTMEVRPIDRVNIGDALSESLHDISGWSTANLPGDYGERDDGTYRQIIEESSCTQESREAKFTLYSGSRNANLLRIRALDGQSNLDSFDVLVNGNLVGSYSDINDSVEAWHDLEIPLNNLSGRLEVILRATDPIWGSCPQFGQVAVSWAEIEGFYCAPDETNIPGAPQATCPGEATLTLVDPINGVDIGDSTSETGYGMIGWSTANLPGNYGERDDGTFRQIISENYCSDEYRVAGFTINTGSQIANLLRLKVLDGISNKDSFDVYVNDQFIAHLPDLTQNHAETWQIYEIGLPNLSGELRVRLVAIDGFWDMCETYGQVAVSWAQVAGYSCEETNSPIVLNEILYNPIVDSGSMPDGEWVELYNKSDQAIDVAGWYVQDVVGYSLSHRIIISTANSDNDTDLSDGGETVVPAHGWLVVYRNGSAIFNNDGDTVELYDNNNVLTDSHTYDGGKGNNVTEARIPDGTGAWVDPIPTPGKANKLEEVLPSEQPIEQGPSATPEVSSSLEASSQPSEEPTPSPSTEPTPSPEPSASPESTPSPSILPENLILEGNQKDEEIT